MKMQYEIIETNRKKRFNQLISLLKSEMVTKNEMIFVIETKSGPVLKIRNNLISTNLNINSEEFIDFSIGNYDKESIIKTMLTIKLNLWGSSLLTFIDVPLTLTCDIEMLKDGIIKIYEKYGFEKEILSILIEIEDNKQSIYAYDLKWVCDSSGELKPTDLWVYSTQGTYVYYVKGVF